MIKSRLPPDRSALPVGLSLDRRPGLRIARQERKISGTEGHRSRKATANRVFSVLRAALNRAFQEGQAGRSRLAQGKTVQGRRARHYPVSRCR
jgi:hypothetical protein